MININLEFCVNNGINMFLKVMCELLISIKFHNHLTLIVCFELIKNPI